MIVVLQPEAEFCFSFFLNSAQSVDNQIERECHGTDHSLVI